MSAELLHRAAAAMREDWPADGDITDPDWYRQMRFHRAIANWLDRAAVFYQPPATGTGPRTRRIRADEWTGRPMDRDMALEAALTYLDEVETS